MKSAPQLTLIEGGKVKREAKPLCTLRVFIANMKAQGMVGIPKDHAVYRYAKDIQLPTVFMGVAWYKFKDAYLIYNPEKKYRDWLLVFQKAVKNNWFGLWCLDAGEFKFTSKGQQAQKAMQAEQQRPKHDAP